MSMIHSFHPRRRQSGAAVVIAIVAVAFVVLASAGAFIAYKVLQRKVGSDLGFQELAERAAPANTLVFLSFNLEKMGMDASFLKEVFKISKVKQGYEEFKQEFKSKSGQDWKEETVDILMPRAMAISMAPDASLKPGELAEQLKNEHFEKLGIVVMLELSDAAKWLTLMQDMVKDELQKNQVRTEDYKGATLYLPPPAKNLQPAFAIKDGVFWASPMVDALKHALDASASAGGLGTSERFKKAMSEFAGHEDGALFVDVKSILAQLPPLPEEAGQYPMAKKIMTAMEWMAAGGRIGADKRGVTQVKIKLGIPAGDPLAAVFVPAGATMTSASVLPAKISFYAAYNLRPLYDIAMRGMASDPATQAMAQLPAAALAEKGIDLQADILDTITGELGMAFSPELMQLPPGQDDLSMFPMAAGADKIFKEGGMFLALGLKDIAKFEALLTKFGGPMLQQMPVEDYKGAKIRAMGPFAMGYVDKYLVIAGLGGRERLVKLIDSPSRLSGDEQYKRIPPPSGKADGFLETYFDAESYAKLIMSADPTMGGDFTPEDLAILQKLYGRFGVALSRTMIVGDGIETQSVTQFK